MLDVLLGWKAEVMLAKCTSVVKRTRADVQSESYIAVFFFLELISSLDENKLSEHAVRQSGLM